MYEFSSRDLKMVVHRAIKLVQKSLSPELLSAEWRAQSCPLEGHCYVASEALWHLLGRKDWKPMVATYFEGERRCTHWWLEHRVSGVRADPTREQYLPDIPPYEIGRGSGFLTRKPSKRAKVVIERVRRLCER